MRSFDLFSGGGGLSLGAEMAGVHPVALIEWDKPSCVTLNKNRPEWNVINESVIDACEKGLIQYIKGEDKSVDLVIGGFPCQTFSVANRAKKEDDPRSEMFNYFAESLRQLQPKAFVAENVDALTFKNNKEKYQEILSCFKDCGYTIYTEVLVASSYGAATKRKRLIIVGIRNDLHTKEFVFPESIESTTNLIDVLPNYSDLRIQSVGSKTSRMFEQIPTGGTYKDIPSNELELYLEGLSKHAYEFRVKRTVKLSWYAPCLTLTTRLDRGPYLLHPGEPRIFNVGEACTIQGFPDGWFKHVSCRDAYKQIGNSVPPKLGFAVINAVKEYLLV
jgi:DNA (cytosine-5)-methyltransferase 1